MSVVSLSHLHIVYWEFSHEIIAKKRRKQNAFTEISSTKTIPLHFEFPVQFNVLIWVEFIRKVVHGFKKFTLSVPQLYPNLLRANIEPANKKLSIMKTNLVNDMKTSYGKIYWLLLLNY